MRRGSEARCRGSELAQLSNPSSQWERKVRSIIRHVAGFWKAAAAASSVALRDWTGKLLRKSVGSFRSG